MRVKEWAKYLHKKRKKINNNNHNNNNNNSNNNNNNNNNNSHCMAVYRICKQIHNHNERTNWLHYTAIHDPVDRSSDRAHNQKKQDRGMISGRGGRGSFSAKLPRVALWDSGKWRVLDGGKFEEGKGVWAITNTKQIKCLCADQSNNFNSSLQLEKVDTTSMKQKHFELKRLILEPQRSTDIRQASACTQHTNVYETPSISDAKKTTSLFDKIQRTHQEILAVISQV